MGLTWIFVISCNFTSLAVALQQSKRDSVPGSRYDVFSEHSFCNYGNWQNVMGTTLAGCEASCSPRIYMTYKTDGNCKCGDYCGTNILSPDYIGTIYKLKPSPTPSPPCDNTMGTCSVVEDPHIGVFDGAQISLLVTTRASFASGDHWLVKSGNVSIQARFVENTAETEMKEFVRAVAVGGPFLNGNIMVIGSLEDQITWNGMPILSSQDSSFELTDDVSVKATRSKHSTNVAVPSEESAGLNIELPMDVSLIVNRMHGHLNVAIKMTPQEGGQEGLCGNYNGLANDDSLEFQFKRFSSEVLESESLFTGTVLS